MPLDPGVASLLQIVASSGAPPFEALPAARSRAGFRRLTLAANAMLPVIEVAEVVDTYVNGPVGPVPIRVYRPSQAAAGPVPTIVFAHGGGFVVGDIDTHDPTCRRLCADVGVVVVSVDYRLAPEDPYPAAVEDVLAVVVEVAADIASFGGDGGRVAVGGDSAGGGISAAVAQRCRDRGGPALAAQLLVYASTDHREDEGANYPSRAANGTGYLLEEGTMRWFSASYCGDTDRADPGVSPVLGELTGLPPAVIVTAEFDPLRDEGTAFAAALEAAGVATTLVCFEGMIHGFLGQASLSPACEAAVATTYRLFAEALDVGVHAGS